MVDKELHAKEESLGIRHVDLPVDGRLRYYSGGLIIFLTLFYTAIYNNIDISPALFDTSGIKEMLSLVEMRALFVFIALVGAYIFIQAREGLSMLTSKEVVFSLNNKPGSTKANAGVYTYMHHPMYVGITLITLASLLLFPSVIGAIFLLCAYICLYLKICLENKVSH